MASLNFLGGFSKRKEPERQTGTGRVRQTNRAVADMTFEHTAGHNRGALERDI